MDLDVWFVLCSVAMSACIFGVVYGHHRHPIAASCCLLLAGIMAAVTGGTAIYDQRIWLVETIGLIHALMLWIAAMFVGLSIACIALVKLVPELARWWRSHDPYEEDPGGGTPIHDTARYDQDLAQMHSAKVLPFVRPVKDLGEITVERRPLAG